MRSKKVEAAIKKDHNYQAVGEDFSGKPIEEYTNAKNTAFCPFLDHLKLAKTITSKNGLGIIHRSYPTGHEKIENKRYHWVQLQTFQNAQFCKLQRDPIISQGERDITHLMCEKRFTECLVYKQEMRKNV